MDIAVIGSNMVDLISYIVDMPKEGETLEAPDFKMGFGGKGTNQAVAAAKMGSKVMMVTKVGDDLFADNTIKNLESHGIDTEFTSKVTGTSSGVAPIFVDQESKNRILIIKGANQHLLPADVDRAAGKLKTASLIILQLEIPLPTVYRAIDFGREHNIPVIVNPAPASKELDFDYVCKSDFFIPNESELEILTNMPVATDEQIKEAASILINKGVENVIVTMGNRGVMWITKEKSVKVASQKVTAVDTTGAGDAFIGCFAHFLVQNGDVLQAIKKAAAFAGLSVTKRGTQSSYPTSVELEAFLMSRN
ncbi:ribokinase [Peribacillus simplex]|uniref:Deoxyribokinase n=1 Tax=Peribacillus simplex TaxID=1478 RepID=A0A109N0P4_9BACI|nr:ribokinase [Peribacillus simplex]KWW21323.1 ribokinase [Peribacillus simplex]